MTPETSRRSTNQPWSIPFSTIALATGIAIAACGNSPARLSSEITACKAEAVQRRQDRLAIAATRDIDQLRAIAPEYRLPEEQQRVAEADAARAALIAQRQNDPKWAGPVLSAAICIASDRKAGAAKEIQTEYAYAKQYGGIIDQSKIYDLQQQIRTQDDAMAETRRLMGQLRAPVQSCQAKLVRQLAGCMSPPDGAGIAPACGTKQLREYLELASPP